VITNEYQQGDPVSNIFGQGLEPEKKDWARQTHE
jgi:hypothetical protein